MDTSAASLAQNSDNISWVALLVVILVLSLATILVAARFYTRIFILKHVGWDDYCVLLSLIVAIADGGAVLSTIPFGLGRHTATLDPVVIPLYLRSFWVSIVMYGVTLTLIKLTFLVQYYRVLSVYKMKRVIWIMGTIIMMWSTSQLLIVIFSCTPVNKFWQMDVPGTCMSNLPFWYINAAGNIATDLAIFIMPLPALSKLQLGKKQKYMLLGIFSLGFFTCTISLIRLKYLRQSADFTYENVASSAWSVGEVSSGIICACLPTLRPLVVKIKPNWITNVMSWKSTHRGYGSGESEFAGKSLSTHHSRVRSTTFRIGNHSKLQSRDVEKAMPSPSIVRFTVKHSSSEAEDTMQILGQEQSVEMNELDELEPRRPQPGAKRHSIIRTGWRKHDTNKASEVLGMGMSGVTSTEVVGGAGRQSVSLQPNTEAAHPSPSTIEVKRSVTITSSQPGQW